VKGLPDFSVESYRTLLHTLTERGVELAPVSAMPEPNPGRVAYLRHDIDLHVPGVEPMAAAEAEMGAQATYFVLVTQYYNPLYPPNRAVLRELVAMDHEIGLHYDLMTYPTDPDEALAHLEWEIGVLSGAVGAPVRCISMHQPYQGKPDLFRELAPYIHPHNPAYGQNLTYVSDSCRGWRDESLLDFVNGDDPQGRLLLLAHPESWLDGSLTDRMSYLDRIVMPNAVRLAHDFVDVTVRGVWENHPGAAMHDAREAGRRPAGDEAVTG
jgi:hypothetical protein